jgi:Transcriptional Coactivator p15 (PC4)
MSDVPLYEKIIAENIDKGTQLRLVISEFRDEQYLHLRKYYLSYEGEYVPSKEGASFPASISSVYALLDGLIDICSHEESAYAITKYFQEKLEWIKSQNT